MQALREIFVKMTAEFDFAQFRRADQQVNKLDNSLTSAAQNFDVSNVSVRGLAGSLRNMVPAGGAAAMALGVAAAAVVALATVVSSAINTVVSFVQRMTSAGAEIARVSSRLHVSTVILSAWRSAAVGAGASAADLDGVLTKLRENIGKALNDPTGQSARNFQRVGLSIDNLRRMSIDQIFRHIAESVRTASNESQALATASGLLGSSVNNLTEILAGGSAALDSYIARFKQTHPEHDRFVANSEELQSALDGLYNALGGLAEIIVNEIAPTFTAIVIRITKFIEAITSNEQAILRIRQAVQILGGVLTGLGLIIMLIVGGAIGALVAAFGVIIIAAAAVVAIFSAIGLVINDVINYFLGVDSVTRDLISVFDSLLPRLTNIWNETLTLVNIFGGLQIAIDAVQEFLRDSLGGAIDFAIDKFISLKTFITDVISSISSFFDVSSTLQTVLNSLGLNNEVSVRTTPGVEASTYRPAAANNVSNSTRTVNVNSTPQITINEATDVNRVRSEVEAGINNANIQISEGY